MKQRNFRWFPYLLPAFPGGGFCFCLANIWECYADQEPFAFSWMLLAAFFLVILIVTILWLSDHNPDDKLREDIRQLSRTLEKNGERYPLVPAQNGLSMELIDLNQNIRNLCNSLRLMQIEKKIRKNQLQYIFSSLNEGFLLLDLNQHILTCNHVAENVLKLPPDAEHRPLREVLDHGQILAGVQESAASGQSVNFDLPGENGSVYAVQIRMGRVSREKQSGILVLLLDVTAERNFLQQRQDFLSNASHELRTPITSILGFAEMLENNLIPDPEQQAQSIRIIRREAKRMSRIIDDLLFISKLEDGEEVTDSPPVNVREVALEIQETLQPTMQEKNVRMEISGGDFPVLMPYSHLYNLLANLMQNAVKYNVENGSVWVRIETDGRQLHVGVRDTGIGIPPEMKTRVFERFFRVDKGRSRKIGGTGLGLSIVKHLVSLYHGEITLDSEPGKGSFFQFILPCPGLQPPA